jgi:hypothetical protein
MRELFIDSRDRISGTSTNFSIQLREQLVVGPENSFRIDYLRVPLVIPRIQLGINDRLYFTVSGTRHTATLAAGNYSGVELAAELQTALRVALTGVTFTATYNNSTASLSVFCSNASFRVLTDADVQAAKLSTPTFASELFQNTSSYASTGAGVTLLWSYVSMQAVDIMYLTSTRLSNQDTFGPNGSTDALMCAIPDSDFATVMVQSMPADVFINCPTISSNQLDFQLRDRNYNILQNLPNISFVLTLK